jgi:aminoglycoside 3-N-acetyltransferase
MDGNGVVTQTDLCEGLRALGVRRGDVVLAHTSLSSFGHVAGGADAVIDALLEAVGEAGTVMVPTHTWSTVNARNTVFDVRRSPSVVGRVTEVFRHRPEAIRSLHPTHSCAAIGRDAEAMVRDHETQITPCGRKSPYQRLMDRGGKILFLGCTLLVNTSYHAVEEMANVPYLFRDFQMLYTIDYEDRKRPVPSRRHYGGPRDYPGTEPILAEAGALVAGRIGHADVRVVDAAQMEAVIMPLLAENPFMLLRADMREPYRAYWLRDLECRP